MVTLHLGPYPLDEIYTGDARELSAAIPDESVDLIFTDPVYDRMDDYAWLAETAARVLKPSGACLVWSNGRWHHANATWMERGGLTYRWDFACVMVGGAQPMNGRIIAKTNRIIWLDIQGESRLLDYWPDGFVSPDNAALRGFKWTKSPEYTAHGIRNLCPDNGIVFDPFCGGGTVPAVCKLLGRHYLGFEIDPDTAERARYRVACTQPPLFVPEAEQPALLEPAYG